jgi:hypothetical protein
VKFQAERPGDVVGVKVPIKKGARRVFCSCSALTSQKEAAVCTAMWQRVRSKPCTTDS